VYNNGYIGTNCLSNNGVTIRPVHKIFNLHELTLCILGVVKVVVYGHETGFEAQTNREVKYDCFLISVKVTAE